jgi:hypothetical protein
VAVAASAAVAGAVAACAAGSAGTLTPGLFTVVVTGGGMVGTGTFAALGIYAGAVPSGMLNATLRFLATSLICILFASAVGIP